MDIQQHLKGSSLFPTEERLWYFCQTRKLYLYSFIPGFSVMFCWVCIYSVPVSNCFHHYSLKLDIMIPLGLVFALGVVLATATYLCFHMNFRVFFPISVKNTIGALTWNCTQMVWPLFTASLLPIHDHGKLFHTLVSLSFLHLVSHGFHCGGLSSLHLC